jgi:hypothetical protein
MGPGSVKTAPPNGKSSAHPANGASATGDAPAEQTERAPAGDAAAAKDAVTQETGTDNIWGADPDATAAVRPVPALPGDNIASPASDDWMASGPADSTADLFSTDPSPSWSAGSSASSSSASALPSRPAPPSAEPPAMAPAAFVWDMPDPPPTSPSSPARTFLRADAKAKSPAAKAPAVTVDAKKPPPGLGASSPSSPPSLAAQAAPQGARKKAPSKRSARTAHLTIARVEPWSVMKFSFVVSLVAFVILFVAVSVLYATLSAIGVFDSLQHVVSSLTSSQDSAGVNAAHWFSASRVLSYTAILGGFNIVLITAMSTIGAVVYNLTSRLVGGVEVTLRETEE